MAPATQPPESRIQGTLERLWKTADLRAEACRRLTRNLTAEEWQQYLGAIPYGAT